jgi:hypothetical protein
MKIKVTKIDNGSHGYYSVSKDIIRELDLIDQISSYSGMTRSRVYLEEDADANLLFQECEKRNIKIEVKDSYNLKFKNSHNYKPSYFNLSINDRIHLWNEEIVTITSMIGEYIVMQSNINKTYRCTYNRLLRSAI